MVKAVFDELAAELTPNALHRRHPRRRDRTCRSPSTRRSTSSPTTSRGRCSTGSAPTARSAANKAVDQDHRRDHRSACQGHFVYDSKKSGSTTVSHLRFGPRPIRSTYRIRRADFVAVHDPSSSSASTCSSAAAPGATVLLNCRAPPTTRLGPAAARGAGPAGRKRLPAVRHRRHAVAERAGLGRRINTVMQTCFFALAGVLPADEAIAASSASVEATWGRRGPEVVRRNLAAIDAALAELHEVAVPARRDARRRRPPAVPDDAPDFVQRVTRLLLEGHGDQLPVSAFPPDGTWPTGTSRFEKRAIALDIPIWEPDLCVQCNLCSMICPHAAIRTKVFDPADAAGAPDGFRSVPEAFTPEFEGSRTPCRSRPTTAPAAGCASRSARPRTAPSRGARPSTCEPLDEHRDAERAAFDFFEPPRRRRAPRIPTDTRTLAAAAAAVRVLRRLRRLRRDAVHPAAHPAVRRPAGDRQRHRLLVDLRRQPADHAVHDRRRRARSGLEQLAVRGQRRVRPRACGSALDARARARPAPAGRRSRRSCPPTSSRRSLAARRPTTRRSPAPSSAVARLRRAARRPRRRADAATLRRAGRLAAPRSVWIVGGDGWAYDIGYGGLDHVLASEPQRQRPGARHRGLLQHRWPAVQGDPARRRRQVRRRPARRPRKKDLGLLAMTYGHVYVARDRDAGPQPPDGRGAPARPSATPARRW